MSARLMEAGRRDALTRRQFVRSALVGAAACGAAWTGLAEAQAAARKPNVIVIVTDDMGYADVGFTGCRDYATPHLDALAREGVICTNGYVSAPVCSPSRAGFMTGRYQTRFGHERNPAESDDPKVGLPVEQTTIAQLLKNNGYRTGGVGKWHLGLAPRFHPNARGFDEWFGFLGGGRGYFERQPTAPPHALWRDRERVGFKGYLTDAFAREAVAFVERNRAAPFFLYLAFNAPHTPMQAPESYLERVKRIADPKRRTYAAMMTAVDDGVGRLRAKLRELNLERDTLIFFWSDNGGPPRANASKNGSLREGKGTLYEGGIRVPFAVTWPERLPAGRTYNEPVITLDILPTALAAGGARPPAGLPLDGVDILGHLSSGQGVPHAQLFWRWADGRNRALREGRHKWVRRGDGAGELYDLRSDPGEKQDLAARQPELAQRLRAAYESWDAHNIAPVFPGRTTK